jgi:LysM repeat protein
MMPLLEGVHYIYTVNPGDTLYSIAQRFGSTVQLVEQTNAIYPPFTDPGLIYPGQVLVVSETGLGQRSVVNYIIHPGDTLYGIGRRFSATADLLQGINPVLANPNVIFPGIPLFVPATIYEVEPGDTLFGISRRLGIPLQEIIQANQGRASFSPDVLFPNYRLIIPLPSSANIVVYRPLPGTRIVPGQVLEGAARVFEAVVNYHIRDDNGVIVANERYLMTSAGAPSFGSFSVPLVFDRQPTARSGELWVYERSAKDGSIVNLVQVRIYF